MQAVILQSGQKEVGDLLAKIRPEFSNLTNGNGARETVLKRLAGKFEALDYLIKKHTPQRLGTATMEAVEAVKEKYQKVLKNLENVAA